MMFTLAALACASPSPSQPGSAPAPATFDHSYQALARVTEGAVTPDGLVRYAVVSSRRSDLDTWLRQASAAPVASFTADEQLAFWINAYNALTLHLVVTHPQIASLRDLDNGEVWKTRTFTVGGQAVTLDAIEHQRVRPLADGRVHAVLNCGAKGCPPFPTRPLVPTQIQAQLDGAARRWVDTTAMDQRGDTLYLSEIFKWFPGDFAKYRKDAVPGANEAQARAIGFLATYAQPAVRERIRAGALRVAWEPYDWSLNAAP